MRSHRVPIAAMAGLLAGLPLIAGATADVAQAAPVTAPVTSEVISQGLTSAPFKIKARDQRSFVHRRITVQPGGTGGWHTHAGEQVAIIQSGVLTRFDAHCAAHVYRAGDALVEPADPGDVHIGINLGSEPLVLYVVDMLPEGAPVAVPTDNPGCPDLPG